MNQIANLRKNHWLVAFIVGFLAICGGTFTTYGYISIPADNGFTLNDTIYKKGSEGYEEALDTILTIFASLSLIYFSFPGYCFFIGIKDILYEHLKPSVYYKFFRKKLER